GGGRGSRPPPSALRFPMPHIKDRAALNGVVGLALATLAALACGSPPPPPAPPPPAPTYTIRSECLVTSETARDSGDIALAAKTAGDSTMVRQQWELPPVRLDCTGTPAPGSARSWSAGPSGRSWTLVLAESAPDAAEVAALWRDSAAAATLQTAGVRWVIPLDLRRLVVELEQPSDTVPPVLSDPSLAVPADSGGPRLTLAAAAGDPRDALERGAAVVRTSDPDLLAYARRKSDLRVVPLPWSGTYALVLPPGATLSLSAASDSAALRAGLAKDVVPGESRPAEAPFWWQGATSCAPRAAAAPPPQRTGPLLYPDGDPVAAAIAARLVALSDESGLTTRKVPRRALDSLLTREGRAAVVALPKRALVPCRELARWPTGSTIVPLVETRESAVVRRDVPVLAIEYDGTLRPAQVK
ncbi:MAG TPA: hypothetical protein VJQ44_09765, partial [Gemmatimonadales bacterium]|nr:hypothetical protein [Gemmatimonadales bacterium]